MKKNFMLMGLLLLGSGLTWGQHGNQAQYKMFETQRESVVEVGIGKATPGAVVDADTPLESVREQIKHLTSRRDDLSGVKRPKARVAKAPVQPPYYCTFDNAQVLADEWIVIDGDADGRSWYYEWKGFFYPCDGNESSGFAAVLWNQDGEANEDWMITAAPVSLPAGTSNISFYYGLAQPFFVEKLRVFYSKTPDTAMEKLTELGEFEIMMNTGWYFAHIDFELPEAGDYYFSFLYQVPDDNQYGVMLDNIRIDKGAFVGTPDLQVERVVLPPASCNLGAAERIGVSLHNAGSADITKWAMTYSVNGGEPVREVFTETLAEGESKLAYFTQTADLSVAGTEYQVVVNVEVLEGIGNREEKIDNNTGRNSVLHFEPLEKLPYFADLRTEAGRLEVGYNPDFWKPVEDGSLNALTIDPLVTRCMLLEAGERYRFIFEYKAGFTGFLIGPDIFNIVYGPSDKPVSEWDTLKRYTVNTKNAYVRDEIEFEQKEPGSYSFGICLGKNSGMNYQGTFFISDIRIEKIYDYDIQVSKVQATLARYMPARHALRPTFNVALVNRGEKDVEKVKLTVKNGAEQIAVSEEKAIKRNDTVSYVFDGTLARPAVNSDVTLMVVADMEHADDNPEDNEKAFLFTATDTLYAFDDVTIEEYENGVGLQGFLLGNLFTLLETDTLTSVTLGWMDLTAFPLEPLVRMEICAVTETGETGDCVYVSDIERPKAGGVQTVAIPPRVLAAGRYLIGVQQVGVDNMTLGYDGSPTGFFYVRRGNRVQTLSGYGNMALRANFGKTDRAYAKDIEILGIEQPMDRGVFSANEKIVVNYRNNGHEKQDMEFRCKVDGNDISQIVTVPAYAIGGQVVFEADLSRKGAHDITVEAVLAGDENPENNVVKKTVMCIVEDPYVMDFELCNDFATDLYPWTSVDVDLGYTAGIYGYDWPGCMAPMGFMAFNPYLTTPSIDDKIVPHDGERIGAAFVSSEGVNNDWLISPKLKLPEQDARLRFYTRAFSEFAERYNVLVSVTTADLSAFEQLGETYTAPDEWDETVVDLSAYAGQEVYLAIQCVSEDAFILLIDGIMVSKPVSNECVADLSMYVKSYPNPVTDVWTVTAYGLEIDRVEICDMAGSVVFRSASRLATETWRVNMDGFTPGLYMARVYTNAGVQTLKVVVK